MVRHLILIIACLLPISCTRENPATTDPLTLVAAASTYDAAMELAADFTARTGTPVRVTTGPTNALARQLIQGSPGDLFLAAHPLWADAVLDARPDARAVPLLTNQLVLVVPRGRDAVINGPGALNPARVRRLALAAEEVPAGRYADQALRHHDRYEALRAAGCLARATDVRVALAWVATGEADAGIVYASDAHAAGERVRIVHTFEPSHHDPIRYPLVLLDPAATALFDHFRSADAAAIFAAHGFTPLP